MSQTVDRIKEHLDHCIHALNGRGANGVNHLQLHLRMLTEWGFNLGAYLRLESTPQCDREKLQPLYYKLKSIESLTVLELPDALKEVQATYTKIFGD